jgi:hypothetical protein
LCETVDRKEIGGGAAPGIYGRLICCGDLLNRRIGDGIPIITELTTDHGFSSNMVTMRGCLQMCSGLLAMHVNEPGHLSIADFNVVLAEG